MREDGSNFGLFRLSQYRDFALRRHRILKIYLLCTSSNVYDGASAWSTQLSGDRCSQPLNEMKQLKTTYCILVLNSIELLTNQN